MSVPFTDTLEECRTHARYLGLADDRLPRLIGAEHYAAPTDAFVAAMDQFLFRFMRLQDAMGARLLPGLLIQVLREPYEERPLRDVLDRLERLGVLPSADRWVAIRVLRNRFAHEYPESPAEKAAYAELGRAMAAEMQAIVESVAASAV